MKEFVIKNWGDYWEIFDELIDLLEVYNSHEIVEELKEAQKYVNGFTDGWFDFKERFEQILQSYRIKMTKDQANTSDFLISSLNKSLANRS